MALFLRLRKSRREARVKATHAVGFARPYLLRFHAREAFMYMRMIDFPGDRVRRGAVARRRAASEQHFRRRPSCQGLAASQRATAVISRYRFAPRGLAGFRGSRPGNAGHVQVFHSTRRPAPIRCPATGRASGWGAELQDLRGRDRGLPRGRQRRTGCHRARRARSID